MYKVTEVKALDDYRIWLKYADGIQGEVDLSDLVGKGVFSSWTDYSFFKSVSIGPSGEIRWGDKIDICSDSLFMRLTGKKPSEIFPNLKDEPVHA